MTLPTQSAKRKAAIAAGLKMRGTFVMPVGELQARGSTMSKKVADTLFGKGKPQDSQREARKKAKAKAWKAFSLFIRLRDSDANGIVTCCTCGSRKPWKKVQAGHYVTRAKEATLFDEQCVQGQCAGCNMWQGGKPLEFEQYLDRKYGKGTAEKIRIKAVQPCKRVTSDYLFIEKTFTERVAWIKQHEPSKFTAA